MLLIVFKTRNSSPLPVHEADETAIRLQVTVCQLGPRVFDEFFSGEEHRESPALHVRLEPKISPLFVGNILGLSTSRGSTFFDHRKFPLLIKEVEDTKYALTTKRFGTPKLPGFIFCDFGNSCRLIQHHENFPLRLPFVTGLAYPLQIDSLAKPWLALNTL